MKTCISLECPFMTLCKHYNFLIDRGESCPIQEKIVYCVGKYREQQRRKRKEEKKKDMAKT